MKTPMNALARRVLVALGAAAFASFAAGQAVAAAVPADPVAAANDPRRFEDVFTPFTTEVASLSPDGKHLAYSLVEDGLLHVVIVAIDDPAHFRAKVAVNSVKAAQPDLYHGGGMLQEEMPMRI